MALLECFVEKFLISYKSQFNVRSSVYNKTLFVLILVLM